MTLVSCLSPLRSAVFLAAVSALTGCSAHASGVYGDRVHYVAAYDAYVVTKDPTAAEPRGAVLADPITGKKLRCAEDVESRLAVNASATEDETNDEYWGKTSLVTLFPFAMVGGTLTVAGEVFVGSALVLRSGGPRRAHGLYQDGLELFGQGRYAEAIPRFEVAVLRHDVLRAHSHAVYYLGLAYEQLHQDDRAVNALETFVERGLVADRNAYVTAAERLKRLRHPLRACRSREPLVVRWPPPH